MVSSVSLANEGPVRTIELMDHRSKRVRKFTNTTEAVDKYYSDVHVAQNELVMDASYGAAAAGVGGFCLKLLYDGIKKSKFYFGKSLVIGVFSSIVGFGAVALFDYKTKICKIAEDFMKDSEKKFMQKDYQGVKYDDYVKSGGSIISRDEEDSTEENKEKSALN